MEPLRSCFSATWKLPNIPQDEMNVAAKDKHWLHTYDSIETTFFVPDGIKDIHAAEFAHAHGMGNEKDEMDAQGWREYFSMLPQLKKPGPNGEPINTSGVILTEDVIIGYFDEVVGDNGEKNDVLHVILLFSEGTNNDRGWVLPGKRDRAYGDFEDKSIPNSKIFRSKMLSIRFSKRKWVCLSKTSLITFLWDTLMTVCVRPDLNPLARYLLCF